MPLEELATRIGAVVFMFIGSIMLIAALIYPLTFYRQFFDPAGGRKALKPQVILMSIASYLLELLLVFYRKEDGMKLYAWE